MEPLLKVKRYSFAKDWTLSKYFINDELTGFGVEDEVREVKVHGETAVPPGTYKLGVRSSPKFSTTFFWSEKLQKLIDKKTFNALPNKGDYQAHELIWIMDVPNFQFILIHWGNCDDDTDGCYIVGSQVGVINGQEGVLASRANYLKMYPKVYPLVKKGGQVITIA